MPDVHTAGASHRTAISIEVFDGAASEALKELLDRRRRILTALSRNSRLRAQHSSGGRQITGPVATWTVFAGNGRPIASSAELFSDETSAERSALATMARVEDIEVLQVRGHVAPAHAWAMRIDGVPRLIALRYFATARLRDRNATSVLGALRNAMVVPPGDGRPHARLPSPGSPLGLALDDDVVAEIGEPLKLRGADRPIRPIFRSYVDQPVRTRHRTPRDGS